jgi:hypothetical protein
MPPPVLLLLCSPSFPPLPPTVDEASPRDSAAPAWAPGWRSTRRERRVLRRRRQRRRPPARERRERRGEHVHARQVISGHQWPHLRESRVAQLLLRRVELRQLRRHQTVKRAHLGEAKQAGAGLHSVFHSGGDLVEPKKEARRTAFFMQAQTPKLDRRAALLDRLDAREAHGAQLTCGGTGRRVEHSHAGARVVSILGAQLTLEDRSQAERAGARLARRIARGVVAQRAHEAEDVPTPVGSWAPS